MLSRPIEERWASPGDSAPRSTAALPLVNRGGRRFLCRVGKDLTPFVELRLVDLTLREALLQKFKSRLLRCFRLRSATATVRHHALLCLYDTQYVAIHFVWIDADQRRDRKQVEIPAAQPSSLQEEFVGSLPGSLLSNPKFQWTLVRGIEDDPREG